MKTKAYKKILSMLLAISMSVAVFTACGDNKAESSKGEVSGGSSLSADTSKGDTSAAPTTDGDGYKIVMAYMGNEQPNDAAVMAKAGEQVKNDIGMEFETMMFGWGDFKEKLNLVLSGGDKIDIVPLMNEVAPGYINAGQVVDLREYFDDYGKDIIAAMGEDIAKSGSVNGFIYGIPSNKESASQAGIVMRKDIVDELQIDVDSIKTYDDLVPIFEKVKAAHPELDVITGTNLVDQIQAWDPLMDRYGVLMDNGQSTKVENLYETDLYKTRVQRVNEWYKAGYVKLDAATSTETRDSLVRAGTLFSYISTIKPGFLVQENALCAREMVVANLANDDGSESNMICTNNVNFIDWGIAQQSEDKVKAMQFLNYAYTSPEWNDIMNFGIEGEDYVKVEGSDVFVDYPEGVEPTSVYHRNAGWMFPNQFVGSIWNGQPEDIWQQYLDFNASATYSKAFGFIYNPGEISTEITAVSSVWNEFQKPLESGSVSDVEASLKDFNAKLNAAGLQKIIAEKQTQLDAWLAENK